jgi:hypothetical protein
MLLLRRRQNRARQRSRTFRRSDSNTVNAPVHSTADDRIPLPKGNVPVREFASCGMIGGIPDAATGCRRQNLLDLCLLYSFSCQRQNNRHLQSPTCFLSGNLGKKSGNAATDSGLMRTDA